MELKANRQPTYKVITAQYDVEYRGSEGYSIEISDGGVLSLFKTEAWGRKGKLIKKLAPGFWQEIIFDYDESEIEVEKP